MFKELVTMWKNTRMVVLTAICAALYAAILIPFNLFLVIPGVAHVRPANAIPIVVSLLFGPAGAWGSAFGNLIGDFFGSLSLASFFGFAGNLFYGMIPYKMWRFLCREYPTLRSVKQAVVYFFCLIVASVACADIIGWGMDCLKFSPFIIKANAIVINNGAISLVLGTILLLVIHPRIKSWGLYYEEIMGHVYRPHLIVGWLGIVLVTMGSLGGLWVGNSISFKDFKSGGSGFTSLTNISGSTAQATPTAPASRPAPSKHLGKTASLSAPGATTINATPVVRPKGSKTLDIALIPFILMIITGALLL